MRYYSEYGEDSHLFCRYPDFFSKPQFYVDIGCAHPATGSNTAFLRELDWKGLHIDGDKSWEKHWGSDFIHAVVSNVPKVRFETNPVHVLSRVGEGEPNTVTVPLSEILERAGVDKIGLMSIDVEGHEYEVLSSFYLHKYWPKFIISEYNTAGIGEDYSVKNYLEAMGYETIHKTVANFIYARRPTN
jgi:hypothetical protein